MFRSNISLIILSFFIATRVFAFQDMNNSDFPKSGEPVKSDELLFPADADKFSLPWITAGYTYGYFGSSIKNFEDDHVRRGMTGGVFAFKMLKNVYMIYQIGHIVCKKTGIGYKPTDHYGKGKVTFFRENIHNMGIRLAFPEAILESKDFFFWIGGGYARLNSKYETRKYESEIIYSPDGYHQVEYVETTVEPLCADGLYSELGVIFIRPMFGSQVLPKIGMGLNFKYDTGKKENEDLGGFSVMMQVNLILK
jgi:hypothetical protein